VSRDNSGTSDGQNAIRLIGTVESSLNDLGIAPRQPDEGAPEASLRLDRGVEAGLEGITAGDRIIVLTWLHHARRDVLRAHPRGDTTRPELGVFATRAPDRPNPIGLHDVMVIAVAGPVIRVARLEAIDGTPVLDIKPVLGSVR
jgi:tRNA-Thr(GGU) m(6)t(6)A37 methyltransferase TsaA